MIKKIFTVLIILTLSVFGIYYYFFKSDSKLITEEADVQNEITEIMFSVKNSIQTKGFDLYSPVNSNESRVWWITPDNYSIITHSNPSLSVKLNLNPEIKKDFRTPLARDYRELNSIIKNEMENRGFKLNERNSNTEIQTDGSRSDYTFYDYIQAYEKNGIKCVAVGLGDLPSDINNVDYLEYTFSCTTDEKIKMNYTLQTPFIDLVLNDKDFFKANSNSESMRKDIAIFRLEIKDDRAIASLGGRRGGAGSFFYKEGETWKLIFQGQAAPLCSDLDKRGIPKKFQDMCLK